MIVADALANYAPVHQPPSECNGSAVEGLSDESTSYAYAGNSFQFSCLDQLLTI